jgi:hypothetical protein
LENIRAARSGGQDVRDPKIAAPGEKQIHEIHEAELVLLVRFRLLSWIVLVRAQKTAKPNEDTSPRLVIAMHNSGVESIMRRM